MHRPLLYLTDQELTQLFNSGHPDAFTEIYHRYWLKMFCLADRMLKDPEKAKDAVQDVFTKMLEKRGTIEVKESLVGFVYRGTRNYILNQLDHEKLVQAYKQRMMQLPENWTPETDERALLKELEALLNEGINQLPDKMKETFQLSRRDNLSYKEIAERTSTAEGTVKKQIYLALKILRKRLSVLFTLIIG